MSPRKPGVPEIQSVIPAASGQLTIAWIDNTNNELAFELQRKSAGHNWAIVATLGAGVVTYLNTGLTNGTSYTYRVRATNAAGSTDWSNELAGVPTAPLPPPPPPPPPPNGRYSALLADHGAHNRPALPMLPAKGGKLVDPTFGTTILRVTDAADGVTNETNYSYWPSFNNDQTRLLVISDGWPFLYDFDAVAFTALNRRPLFASNVPIIGGILRFEDLIWSGTTPDEIYGWARYAPTQIYKYNIITGAYTLICDLAALAANLAGTGLWQQSKSLDDDTFAYAVKHQTTYQYLRYVVYRKSTDTLLLNVDVSSLDFDEVQLDKTGRYLVVKFGAAGSVWDLAGPTETVLSNQAPDFRPRHSDSGTGCCVSFENTADRLLFRSLATPHTWASCFDCDAESGVWMSGHISLLSDDENWALLSFDDDMPLTNYPFANEIVLIATDGSGAVCRVCHHRTAGPEYHGYARANISRDGRFVAFTSNWETTLGSGRTDFFIAKAE